MLGRTSFLGCLKPAFGRAGCLSRRFAGISRFSPQQFESQFADQPEILSLYRTKKWLHLFDKLQALKMNCDEALNPEYLKILCGLAEASLRLGQYSTCNTSLGKIIELTNEAEGDLWMETGTKYYRNWVSFALHHELPQAALLCEALYIELEEEQTRLNALALQNPKLNFTFEIQGLRGVGFGVIQLAQLLNGQFYDAKHSFKKAIESGKISQLSMGVCLNGLGMAYWMEKKQLYNETKEFLNHKKETDQVLLDQQFEQVPDLLISSILELEGISPFSKTSSIEISAPQISGLTVQNGEGKHVSDVLQVLVQGESISLDLLSERLAILKNPHSMTVLVNLAEFLLRYKGKALQNASLLLAHLYSIRKGLPRPEDRVRILYMFSTVGAEKGDLETAEAMLKEAVQTAPEDLCYHRAEAHKYYALLLDGIAGREGEVMEQVQKAKDVLSSLSLSAPKLMHLVIPDLEF